MVDQKARRFRCFTRIRTDRTPLRTSILTDRQAYTYVSTVLFMSVCAVK